MGKNVIKKGALYKGLFHVNPFSCHWSLSIPPDVFRGYEKRPVSNIKWVK